MGRIIVILYVLFHCWGNNFAADLKAIGLRVESKTNPRGVASLQPLLSWKLGSQLRNTKQMAYQVLVSNQPDSWSDSNHIVWNSGKIEAGTSIQLPYQGKPLSATQRYYWKVKVWDNHGNEAAWSEPASWQMGLFTEADWKGAQWIAYDELPEARRDPLPKSDKKDTYQDNNVLPLLRKSFQVQKTIKQATLFISGLGHFEVHINGDKVGDHFLDAGWVKYDKEALYETFDITESLKKGENAMGVLLGNGFYYIPPVKGRYRKQKVAFGYPKMICRLQLRYTDGSQEDIVSNETWKTDKGPITFSSIYGGEDYDARLEQEGWDDIGSNDSAWKQAIIVEGPPQINPQMTEPLKVMERFEPKSIRQTSEGNYVYDFGQNASGIVQIQLKGNRGDTVWIYPGELLKDGAVTQKASGSPYYFTYVLKGKDEESWRPRFSYYGFRYVEVRGAVPKDRSEGKELPQIIALKSLHIRNAAQKVGSFQSSNDLFNRTHQLIDWAIKSNMMSVFTDCPHREKLGWLEQTHLMGASVHYNYDIESLLQKIIEDMRQSQLPNGLVPEIAPEYVEFNWGGDMFRDSPEWGSASIILPWYLYTWYGNKEVLAMAYPMMKRYISYLQSKATNHILKQGLGDWYDLGPKPPGVSQLTPMGVTGTAIYYYDLSLLIKIAEQLGETKDKQIYTLLAKEVKKAFNNTFFDSHAKQYASGSQTANAMALYMELVDPPYKEAVLNNLIQDIKNRNNALTAGDIGYRYVLRVLERAGRSDVIYDMNSRTDVPGYGCQLAKGATALTESWQALPNVSNNHFMLGHLMEWFYSGLAGIRQQAGSVAFNQLEIRPEVVGDVRSAVGTYESPYGLICSSWKRDNHQFELRVQIPPNTQARVYLPVRGAASIYENGKKINDTEWKIVDEEQGHTVVEIGSGEYRFKVVMSDE
ncbi:family 78 glycoside hydrolase catalytic domain [Olivibacter sp. XZL3]|uniref:family 78 glycoside hydrolase catalytic domain n=1 Tax=Olivibacter sp. XZL3 TaxID=1735116 RepID=UPI00106574C9|nr:family 78 glycoside hydrolase catalytic domain [Olivibacter sp. XZL3]